MTPWFVLSYPRSRTAWLSVFLSGAGVPCLHEGWKHARTAQALRVRLQALQAPIVANSDCANVFFLDEIMQEFPEAKFLMIKNDPQAVRESLALSYGQQDYTELFAYYEAAWKNIERMGVQAEQVDARSWSREDSCRIYRVITGETVSELWMEQIERMLVQLMPWSIQQDQAMARRHELEHVTAAMRRVVWA